MPVVQDAVAAKGNPDRPIKVEAVSSETEINQMMDDLRHPSRVGQPPSPEQLQKLKEIQALPEDERRRAFSDFLKEIPSEVSERSRIQQLPVQDRQQAWGSYVTTLVNDKGNPTVVARNIREVTTSGGDAVIIQSPGGKEYVIKFK